MRDYMGEQIIFNVAATPQAAFTAAVTDIITSNAHGLSNGDCVWVSSSTTLPAGLSASTNYYVVSATTNTFKLSTVIDGTPVNITDTGTGTHTYTLKGKKIFTMDNRHQELQLHTAGNANMTIQIQSSEQDDVDFNAARSSTNRWDYVDIKDLNSSSGGTIAGDTGIVLSGTDDNRHFEKNTNGGKYLCAQITSWTAGKVNLIYNGYND